ncbi:mRNA cleavage and polyadenylation factor CLP1 [Ceratobasidium sp. AG-Ba]|nr:mRNA cleavage and polyadenylation factor CLP1 [Ceratobasidium sp. AG-Ba]
MASNQTLSAVARRKAAKLEQKLPDDPIETLTNTPNASGTSVDAAFTLPLKRKTSALSLKESRAPPMGINDKNQGRKKPKPGRHPTPQQISVDSAPQRAYSPSQPIADSSDEEIQVSLDTYRVSESEVAQDLENTTVHERSVGLHKISGTIFNPVDGQNLFSISPERALAIIGQASATNVLVIQPGESFVFVGTMQFALLQGTIELMGSVLSPSKNLHKVFAPRSHPIPTIYVPLTQNVASLPSSSPTDELTEHLPQHIRSLTSPIHSVILVQEAASGVEGLGQVVGLFRNVFEPDKRDLEVVHCIANGIYALKTEPKYDTMLHIPRDWRSALDTIAPLSANAPDNQDHHAPIVLVRGGKNTGKSTFSRMLMNRLLDSYQQVAFIDCDVGQSEFTPGGMVSLNVLTTAIFGPSFTHLSIPRHAHFIGGTSPKTNPSYYLSALNDLSQRYQLEIRYSTTFDDNATSESSYRPRGRIGGSIPLIVNTQGWVKGMGADLLRSVEVIFEPTHVVDIQSSGISSSSNISSLAQTHKEISLPTRTKVSSVQLLLASIPPSLYPPRFSASDLRNFALMSYFHGRFDRQKPPSVSNGFIEHWDTRFPLRDVAPVVIDINKALENIAIVAPGSEDIVRSELSRALVCGVVGLVAPESSSTHSDDVYIQGGLPPEPQTSRCIGLGFIRGISDEKIQLLTPIPIPELRPCRDLVLGELSMPIWAFLDWQKDDQGQSEVPFLQWGRSVAESAGGERRRIRRNIMRRNQT